MNKKFNSFKKLLRRIISYSERSDDGIGFRIMSFFYVFVLVYTISVQNNALILSLHG